jgi:hypothetical protein
LYRRWDWPWEEEEMGGKQTRNSESNGSGTQSLF